MHLQIEAIASLALMGGLRATEIRLIDIDDIHPDNEFIVVCGKSSFGERQGYREVPRWTSPRRSSPPWGGSSVRGSARAGAHNACSARVCSEDAGCGS